MSIYKIKKSVALLLLLSIAFRASLDLSYLYFINPNFDYAGFELRINFESYIYSWFIYLSSLAVCSSKLSKPSQYLIAFTVFSLIAPLTSLYGLSDREIFPVLVSYVSVVGIYFIATAKWIKVPALPVIRNGESFALSLSFLMVAYLVIWYVISGAIYNFNLNFLKVYDYRSITEELADIGVLSYINTWVYSVFIIFLFSFCLYKKKYVFAFLVFMVQVFFFGVSGHKTILFMPLMVLGLWFYFRKSSSMAVIPALFLLVIISSLCLYYFFEHVLFGSLFIRRVFFVPAALTYDYFSFFDRNEFVFWSNSVLKSLLVYPYVESIPKVIGIYNQSGSSANNGFISSAYAHAGIFGVAIYTILFGLFLRVLDVISHRRLPIWLTLAVTVVPLRSAVVSSDLLTVMLTHGLLVAMFLLFLIREPVNSLNTAHQPMSVFKTKVFW